jgi:hypothetical protein
VQESGHFAFSDRAVHREGACRHPSVMVYGQHNERVRRLAEGCLLRPPCDRGARVHSAGAAVSLPPEPWTSENTRRAWLPSRVEIEFQWGPCCQLCPFATSVSPTRGGCRFSESLAQGGRAVARARHRPLIRDRAVGLQLGGRIGGSRETRKVRRLVRSLPSLPGPQPIARRASRHRDGPDLAQRRVRPSPLRSARFGA